MRSHGIRRSSRDARLPLCGKVPVGEVGNELEQRLVLKGQAGVPEPAPDPEPAPPAPVPEPDPGSEPDSEPTPGARTTTIRLVGAVPPEVWNRLGTKVLPKLRSGSERSAWISRSRSTARWQVAWPRTSARSSMIWDWQTRFGSMGDKGSPKHDVVGVSQRPFVRAFGHALSGRLRLLPGAPHGGYGNARVWLDRGRSGA